MKSFASVLGQIYLLQGVIDNGGFSEGEARGTDRETALEFLPRMKT
jgi:hypothetical protein